MLSINVVTLIPEIFNALHYGIIGRAIEHELVQIACFNPRDWGAGVHRQVDDKPYGGGPGMVMMYEPLASAIKAAQENMPSDCKTVYLSPQGRQIMQADLNEFIKTGQSFVFVAGRYEGVDERIIEDYIDEEWSLGDFVLSGGEFAALAFIDAMIRLLPGSMGHAASADQDSFMQGLLDYPHYTRPVSVGDNHRVPSVLLSGDHGAIGQWRRMQALGKTLIKRPDLLNKIVLNEKDRQLLEKFKSETPG